MTDRVNFKQTQGQEPEQDKMQNRDQEQMLIRLSRELRITRIFCAVSSALTLFVLIAGFVVVNKVQEYADEVMPVVEELSELDVEEFNQTVANVNESLESVDWEQLADTLNEFDVEAMNESLEGLDTEELSETLTNLNDATDALEKISEKIAEKLEPVTSFFGGGE